MYDCSMKAEAIIFGLLVLSTGFAAGSSTTNNGDLCRFFANETKLRDPASCNQYITCVDFVSQYQSCTTDKPFYDKDTQKCVTTLSNNSTCQISCEKYVGGFVNDPSSCNGYYYCKDAETALYGKCPENMHFNGTNQMCRYKSDSTCKVKEFDICSIAKKETKVLDENDCRKYYECSSKGVLTEKTCASGKYYNAITGTCLDKWMVDCPKIPLPDNICGTKAKPVKNKFVSDDATCRGYFYCGDKVVPDPAPIWGSCQNGTFFDATSQSCASPLQVKCPTGADRCDGRSETFVSGSESGCRQYLRCKEGKTVEQKSCGNKFFDETKIACISTPITYQSCARS